MRKEIIVSGILVVLLIGIVTAGLIDYYGKITGTVTVEGLVFYASDGHPSSNSQIWNLIINNYISKEDEISMSATKKFISAPLGIEEMSATNYNIYLDIEIEEEIEGDISISLSYVDENFNEIISICGVESMLINERGIYNSNCDSLAITEIDPSYRLQMLLEDNLGSEANYNIYAQGDTKIEVSRA